MYFLIYSSYKKVVFSEAELKQLLMQFRKKNKELGITGMLLSIDWQFVQLLEGEEEQVKKLYAQICNDNRHKGIVLLNKSKAEERIFPDWPMGFQSTSTEELQKTEGYIGVNSASALQLFMQLQ